MAFEYSNNLPAADHEHSAESKYLNSPLNCAHSPSRLFHSLRTHLKCLPLQPYRPGNQIDTIVAV